MERGEKEPTYYYCRTSDPGSELRLYNSSSRREQQAAEKAKMIHGIVGGKRKEDHARRECFLLLLLLAFFCFFRVCERPLLPTWDQGSRWAAGGLVPFLLLVDGSKVPNGIIQYPGGIRARLGSGWKIPRGSAVHPI